MNIPPYFKKYKFLIEEYLKHVFEHQDCDIDLILDAAGYSVMAGGKRIRGCMSLAIGSFYSEPARYLPLAAGIEMIHAYSLIHDDLPSMDDDDYRRGKLSNHKVFGEDIAILAGDFLMTKAYEIMAEGLLENGFESKNIVKMLVYLSKSLGSDGMVGGQVMDINSSKDKCSIDKLKKIHDLKTGRFIRASLVCPVILSTGHSVIESDFSLEDYADGVGLLFQVVDDILDETSDDITLGKPTGSDKEKDKATFVSLMGLERAENYAENLYVKNLKTLDKLKNKKKKVLIDFMEMVYKRKN